MTMTLIESKTLGTAQASIEFTSIPQTFTDLVAVCSIRTNRAANEDQVQIAINGVTTNQNSRELFGTGSGVGTGTTALIFFYAAAANATSNTFGNGAVYIPNYTGSTNKSFSMDSVGENNATAAYQHIGAGLWSQTTAISSLRFEPRPALGGTQLLAGSIISLYGILKGSDGIVTTSP